MEPGASDVLTHGLRSRPFSTAFLASRAAPIITDGFEVLVHDVIAAIVTAPWSRSNSVPSSRRTGTDLLGRPPSFGAAEWRGLPLPLPELLDGVLPDPSAQGVVAGPGEPREARLIGPFDPLLRDRRRARRVLDFDYLFEAYVPREKRVHGHYVMGVLSGGRMIGRVDIQRVGDELRVNEVFPEAGVPRRVLLPRVRGAGKTLARQLGAELVLPR